MKKLFIFSLILFSTLCFSQNNSITDGPWLGTLEFSGIKLRLIFRIKTENNVLKATLDSPDQGVKDIPVDVVTFKKDSLLVAIYSIGMKYSAVYQKDSTLNGTFEQGGQKVPLVLKKMQKGLVINRPQEPKPPFPYTEEIITFDNPAAKIALAGTLTYPSSGEKFPAVILISGSGPQDRNEFILGHKPFLVLADYLTRRGIAVLRFDDRGVAKSTGNFSSATSADFATDVKAGIAFLKTRKEINPSKIGLMGHSEGGMIAPMVAAESKDVSFMVLMAGPGITGKDILTTQTREIYKKMGATEQEIAALFESSEKAEAFMERENNIEKRRAECERIMHHYFSTMSESRKKELGISVDLFINGFTMMQTPWMKYFTSYDPKPALQKIKIPVLAVNGSKDVQVLADINLKGIEEALKKAGNKKYEIHKLVGLNHLFQEASTGMPAEYSTIEETLNQKFLTLVANWISLQ